MEHHWQKVFEIEIFDGREFTRNRYSVFQSLYISNKIRRDILCLAKDLNIFKYLRLMQENFLPRVVKIQASCFDFYVIIDWNLIFKKIDSSRRLISLVVDRENLSEFELRSVLLTLACCTWLKYTSLLGRVENKNIRLDSDVLESSTVREIQDEDLGFSSFIKILSFTRWII